MTSELRISHEDGHFTPWLWRPQVLRGRREAVQLAVDGVDGQGHPRVHVVAHSDGRKLAAASMMGSDLPWG